MSFANHSVSDLVTIIRNGYIANRIFVSSPISKLRLGILDILKNEGYILDFTEVEKGDFKRFKIFLKYHNNKPSLKEINIYSKPGRRYYCSYDDIPVIKNGLGDCILSTNKGLMTGYKAKNLSVGGEILFSVF
jgi:small subunit ribosomal protein S8|tara:strand:- start:16705 stop:17103 length:399 start_codon:yes stop_codon:yes gene_type:complete